MFKGHPKGLIAAALANMGERFGFYTMMAILVLFLQSKFGLTGNNAGIIYATFYALIYILALVGGLIADKTKNYKGTILTGLVLMAVGYGIMAIPTPTPVPNQTLFLIYSLIGLFVIAFGNGLFKGNLQALVGQMYDQGDYSDDKRGAGFQIFYMFINVGAVVAPFIAPGIRTWWLKQHNFLYNAELPAMCHSHLDGSLTAESSQAFTKLANDATISGQVTDLTEFSNTYLNTFNEGFHYAFGIAIIAMAISFVIYMFNKKRFPDPTSVAKEVKDEKGNTVKMDVAEVRQRIYALLAVYGVVIFFWFSFHQNGLTLTFFARDYTALKFMGINLSVESFQAMNPFFVVFLTPIIVALFGWLKAKGIEPSTPKKIAIGMFIAAMGFVLMSVMSTGLPLHETIDPAKGGSPLDITSKVTPLLLLGTYFILTVAELFISPLGIAFVSKVAPPQYQGLMQGGWLGATALGNQLLFIGAILYSSIPLWLTWGVFVVVCLISMGMMLFMLKWLERVSE
ncbi:MAG: MFS transporter [Bacteroidetes bacterium]|nr:MFS transporter [Bacteroidota bacterium]